MDIVDSQVHVFLTIQLNEALAAMNALGIQSVIIDEVWSIDEKSQAMPFERLPNGFCRSISPLAMAASVKYPDRFSYVQRVDRRDPHLAALFTGLSSSRGCRAVRIDVRAPGEREAIANGGYDELLRLALKHDLPVNVLGRDTGAILRRAAARFTAVNFVVDHCGWTKSRAEWDDVLALATCKNVWLKWSHAHRAFGPEAYPFMGLQSELLCAITAFGIDRILWASDFTHDQHGNTWSDLLHYLRDTAVLSQGDKEWLFGRTARKVFRWEPLSGPTAP